MFEKDIFEDNTDKLIEIVKSKGMEAKTMPYIPFEYTGTIVDRAQEVYSGEDCVVFYGSINFGRKLLKTSWVPGVYLNEKAYECTSYYPPLSDLLLHYDNFIMLPYGVLKDKKEDLFNRFGSRIFIRPNSGTKEFTGFVTTEERFDDDVKLAGFYDVESDLLVLISSAKDLIREFRFVIVDGEVISGSKYRDWTGVPDDYESASYVMRWSKHIDGLCDDQKAWELAKIAARRYNPDRAWTIDIASTQTGTYHVIEIGCFSCAGLYANDLEAIVEAVSKAAEDEWKDIFE